MQLITYIKILGIALTDKRGIHSNRVNKINPQIWVYFYNLSKHFLYINRIIITKQVLSIILKILH